MLLTVTSTTAPATDLGFLLGKHPERLNTYELPFGTATVVFPEATEARATVALLVEVDPVELTRRPTPGAFPLAPYVSPRGYAAGSFLSVALSRVFGSGLRGISTSHPDYAAAALDLELVVSPIPARHEGSLARALFEPLGYEVDISAELLDPALPALGPSPYARLTLRGRLRLAEALGHLYVLLPVLENAKHYFVADDEADKLLRHGESWLPAHPARGLIVSRYLRHQGDLAREVEASLAASLPEVAAADNEPAEPASDEPAPRAASLHDQRLDAVTALLTSEPLVPSSIGDLGCGEGKLLKRLLAAGSEARLVGLDISLRALAIARRRLGEAADGRVELLQGSLTLRDRRLAGLEAITLVEVIEHLPPAALPALVALVFGDIGPRLVVVTTPNVEYNVAYPDLPEGRLRHHDHRFEWTRAEFAAWAEATAAAHGYTVELDGIGPADPVLGAPTSIGVFRHA